MRSVLALLPLFLLSCQGVDRADRTPEPAAPRRPEMLAHAARELSGEHAGEAEAYLVAAGEEAWPLLREVASDPSDPDAAVRARSILFLAGQETDLSVEKVVDRLLTDLTRGERYPYLGVRAIHLLELLGDRAAPILAARSREDGERGEAARRLLALTGGGAEEP